MDLFEFNKILNKRTKNNKEVQFKFPKLTLLQKQKENMNIKIDASYFSLKCKPTLLRPLNLLQIKTQSLTQGHQQHWQLYFFEQFSSIDHAIHHLKTQIEQLFQKDIIRRLKTAQIKSIDDVHVDQLLERVKNILQKCQYYRIKLASKELLFGSCGLYKLCQFPQTLKTCILLTQIQKLLVSISTKKPNRQNEKRSTFIESLQKIAINQIPTVLKSLKQNMYIPSADLLQNVLEKFDLRFDESLTMIENMIESKLDLNNAQHVEIYYRILIHKSCSNLKGVCEYLTFTKNLLLDKSSGALSADHETWVSVYQACLRLYARNPQVRQKKWLQIDQILSSGYIDEEFTGFLLTESVEGFQLSSVNYYMKNLNKTEQQRLYDVVEGKIMSLLDSECAWQHAEAIAQYLDSDSPNESKSHIYNRIIHLINDIIFSQHLPLHNYELFDIQIGLTFFIQSMCKNLHITEKIFNLDYMRLIGEMLAKGCYGMRQKVNLVYRVFVEFVINSFEQSDELASYLQQNQQILTQTLPHIISLFHSYNLNLPKQLYKLIFHSVSSIIQLKPIIYRGIAQLYLTQSFEQTIDLEMFHSQNQAKRIISSYIVELIKQITINNSKENLTIAEGLKGESYDREGFRTFLELKSFKDQLIFNNILMMSTYFGQFLPLSSLSQIINEFYTPLVTDIIWKSAQNESLTILSFLSQQLPIDVLKITYKFLKQGYSIDLNSLSSLSLDFWSCYFSSNTQSRIQAILKQKQFRFESYENLHSLRTLQLVFNMINCVFDKLNEHSQKSIKQLKVMYEWGVEYIEYLQPNIYGILIKSLTKRFATLSSSFTQENVDQFQIYNRTKNISVLDLHICGKYHTFQTFNDFNKIGQTIQHEKSLRISLLLHPCFIKQSSQMLTTLSQESILNSIFQAFVLMENSCLEQVMNDSHLVRVSKMHVEGERYFQNAHNVLIRLKNTLERNNQQQRAFIDCFLHKPLYNRLISHLKLLISKVYMPYMVRLSFLLPTVEKLSQHSHNNSQSLQLKFVIIRTLVQIIYMMDPLFEQHFAELMQVIEENCCEDEQKNTTKQQQLQLSRQHLKAQILLRTLQMFIQCVLSNIKVRSFHIFKLIKLYLSQTSTQIQPFNQVIKFYIDMLFGQFLNKQNYPCFNEEVKIKCISQHQVMNINTDNNQTAITGRILVFQKNKGELFDDKVLQSVQDEQLLLINDIPTQFQKLIIKNHSLTTVQLSCTLSMFINLFARLNFPSLSGGIESMLSKQNDKLVYLDYLMELTQKLKVKSCADTISSREMEILSIDVYGNLACVLKGKVTEEILKRFVMLAKQTLELQLEQETVVTLPIKLLNQRLFSKPSRKLTFSDASLCEFNQMSKLISEFQQEPLAFDLSIKSHLLKISPFIKSNLHLCNLQYIVGSGKASVSKKVLETNHKLIQSILGKNSAKDFIKKYQKQTTKSIKKQNFQIFLSQNAIQEIDNILIKFARIYQSLGEHDEKKVINLHFYFKKICSLIFFVPELIGHILTKKVLINSQEMTFLQIVIDSLNFTLVLFCKFYMVCLKTNGGFCSEQQLKEIIEQTSQKFQSVMQQRLQRLRGKVPLNMVIEIYLKLRLLSMLKSTGCRNLNALRGLSFTIKQSSKFRFRYYKFMKLQVPEHEELIHKVDQQILQILLNRLNDRRSRSNSIDIHHHASIINKLQVMDLCLQHIISSTMVDYAKMRLDDKLKQVFYHSQSQYSIKCLITNSNQMNTLRVLVEDDDENQCSSGEGFDIEEVDSDMLIESQDDIVMEQQQEVVCLRKNVFKGNVFDGLEIVRLLQNNNITTINSLQPNKSKSHNSSEFFPMMEICSDSQMFSTKQINDLKQWLSLCGCQQQRCWIGTIILHQLQRSCDKLLNKQNLTFSFEDAMYLDPQHTDQLQITAFAISQNSNMSSDCCIQEETSLTEIPVIGNRIGESLLSINDGLKMEDNDNSEEIPEQEGSEEEMIQFNSVVRKNYVVENQLQQEPVCSQGVFNSHGLEESGYDVKISIVQEKHVNKFKFQENQIADQMLIIQQNQTNQLIEGNQNVEEHDKQKEEIKQEEYDKQEEIKQEDQEQEVEDEKEKQEKDEKKQKQSEQQRQQEKLFDVNQVMEQDQKQQCVYEGSMEYISINTLGGVNEQMHLQDISQQQITDSRLQSQTIQLPPQLLNGNRQRLHRYTIDDYTFEQGSQQKKLIQNSLVDSLQTQVLNSIHETVTKENIFTLIEEYTLNQEVFKLIKYKIKKASNTDLKKVQGMTEGEVKDEVEKEMRHRGIYVAVSPRTYQDSPQGSLFSINKFINQSFQIDQSKFYAANFKRCDRKTSQKEKIQKIPKLSFSQWSYFVFIYLIKTHSPERKKTLNTNNTLLQSRNLNDLLIKMLCNKDNLLQFLQVILSLLSFEKDEEVVTFFETHTKLTDLGNRYSDVFGNTTNIIVNDLVAKLIVNRIGLPVMFKGRWSYQTRKIIRYDCLSFSSESNLASSRNQGDPLLQVFLRKSIQLLFNQQLSSLPNSSKSTDTQQHGFVKSLSDYFKSVQNFQTNQFPYHIIQDTIKLSNINKNKQSLLTINYTSRHPYNSGDSRIKISLSQILLNTMKASRVQYLAQYEEIFHLMNYLDFETFSEFLEIIVQKYKPLCEKLLDREISILKRFRKSAYSESMSEEKVAEIYWHMRKSSKSSSLTDHDEKDLQFFTKIISSFSNTIFIKFKDSIFKFGFGRQQNKRKQKIDSLKKLLMNPTYEHKYKSIKQEIAQNERQYMMWKLCKSSGILKEDILPVIEKISASFSQCLKKWQSLFLELEEVFGTQRQEKYILFKQCSEFYKIFLSFQLLLQEQEANYIRTMSNLKTKPSLQSTREIGVTGRRKSSISIKIPRGSLTSSLCLFTPSTLTFKSVFRAISPKFSFFSQMIDQSCPELRIHAKYSTLESKLKYLHQKNKGGDLTIEIKRENIWQDTLPYLSEQIAQKNIKIKFVDEIGLDYGGVKRQWITLIVKELLNPNLGLFELSVNGLAFQPSALSFLIPNHLFHFYKFGILVGKALKQNWLLEINFTKSFLKHILGYTLYVEDLQDIDPSTTKSLLWILSNDIGDGDLGIDFIYQFDVLGKKRCIELIQNGKQIAVCEDNKKEYVKKLANYKMTEQIRQQSKAFMSGIQKVVPYETLKLFSYKQLGIYLAGMPTVDVEEMKKYTKYLNFSPEEESVKWFWQTLAGYSEEEKASFLFFLTGSYKVPYGGFKQHPISINKMPASKDYLPVAHTCFSVIDLPQYTSKQKLSYLLDKAIKQGKGFSVS